MYRGHGASSVGARRDLLRQLLVEGVFEIGTGCVNLSQGRLADFSSPFARSPSETDASATLLDFPLRFKTLAEADINFEAHLDQICHSQHLKPAEWTSRFIYKFANGVEVSGDSYAPGPEVKPQKWWSFIKRAVELGAIELEQ